MTTLFERVTGSTPDGKAQRIPIDFIRAMISEVSRGKLSATDIISAYMLTTEQQAELTLFLTKLSAHNDKTHLSNVVFDFLVLADQRNPIDYYRNEANFWQVLDDELAAQGV